jgi:hypothetical protein
VANKKGCLHRPRPKFSVVTTRAGLAQRIAWGQLVREYGISEW